MILNFVLDSFCPNCPRYCCTDFVWFSGLIFLGWRPQILCMIWYKEVGKIWIILGETFYDMPRSRSSSRPASRPSSRPASIISTALNLSPQILNLGDLLITQITGFTEDEDNFDICHDFLVSNLLYHTYLGKFKL